MVYPCTIVLKDPGNSRYIERPADTEQKIAPPQSKDGDRALKEKEKRVRASLRTKLEGFFPESHWMIPRGSPRTLKPVP